MESVDGDIVGRWRADEEPRLEPQWRRLAGRANTRIVLTPAELEQVEEAIEQLLAPYVLRKDEPADTHPAEARWVRLLRYTLPAADPERGGGGVVTGARDTQTVPSGATAGLRRTGRTDRLAARRPGLRAGPARSSPSPRCTPARRRSAC